MCRLEYRKASREDILKVILSEDIHRRFDYMDFTGFPFEVGEYWGAYLDGEIIALLGKVREYHFYVIEDYRHLAGECLRLFESHHDLFFTVPDKFKDAIIFALQHGYRKVDGVYRKWVSSKTPGTP